MARYKPLATAGTVEIGVDPHPHLDEIERLHHDLSDKWASRHSDPTVDTRVLYHYTTIEGLLGILNGRSIWLSSAGYLNDLREVEHGRSIINEVLEEEAQRYQNDEAVKSLLRSAHAGYDPFEGHHFGAFVACFCERGDLLSQWRGYSDMGGGYSLGIRFTEHLRVKFGTPTGNGDQSWEEPVVRKVIYNSDEQFELTRRVIGAFAQTVRDVAASHPDEKKELGRQAAALLITLLVEFLCCFKDPAFKEEQEWRLIRIQAPWRKPVQFRPSNGVPIPYLIAQIDEPVEEQEFMFPLDNVVIGPRLHSDRAERALWSLLESKGAADYREKVRLSNVPLV